MNIYLANAAHNTQLNKSVNKTSSNPKSWHISKKIFAMLTLSWIFLIFYIKKLF